MVFEFEEIGALVWKNHSAVEGDEEVRTNWVNAYINTALYRFNTYSMSAKAPCDEIL